MICDEGKIEYKSADKKEVERLTQLPKLTEAEARKRYKETDDNSPIIR